MENINNCKEIKDKKEKDEKEKDKKEKSNILFFIVIYEDHFLLLFYHLRIEKLLLLRLPQLMYNYH